MAEKNVNHTQKRGKTFKTRSIFGKHKIKAIATIQRIWSGKLTRSSLKGFLKRALFLI